MGTFGGRDCEKMGVKETLTWWETDPPFRLGRPSLKRPHKQQPEPKPSTLSISISIHHKLNIYKVVDSEVRNWDSNLE
jgi:hypothetical protein